MDFSKVLDKEPSVFDPKKEAVVSGITEDMREWHDLGSLHGLSFLENQMSYLYHSMWLQDTFKTMLNTPHILLIARTFSTK